MSRQIKITGYNSTKTITRCAHRRRLGSRGIKGSIFVLLCPFLSRSLSFRQPAGKLFSTAVVAATRTEATQKRLLVSPIQIEPRIFRIARRQAVGR